VSDASTLSHEYEAAADLSQELSRALIELKRSGAPSPQHRSFLQAVVSGVLALLNDVPTTPLGPEAARIPGALVADLRGHARRAPFFVDDLRTAAAELAQGQPISDRSLAAMDVVAAMSDRQTARVFRRFLRS
jgi:hypothetical protein